MANHADMISRVQSEGRHSENVGLTGIAGGRWLLLLG